eukprot:6355546-Lingulodinium_polyedra.AAC.1
MFAVLRTKAVADIEERAGLHCGIQRFRFWDFFGKMREADPNSTVAQRGNRYGWTLVYGGDT